MKRSSLERVTVGTTVQPKATAIPTDARLYHRGGEILARITRLLAQQKTDHAKLCALHAPDDECLAKGKAHHRYKFGVKVSVDTTNREELVLGMLAVPGNPYDGHTLAAGWAGRTHDWCCRADRGYRGHGLDHRRVFISGQRRGITPKIRREPRRRSAIEPVIGHMKSNGRLDRNFLAGCAVTPSTCCCAAPATIFA